MQSCRGPVETQETELSAFGVDCKIILFDETMQMLTVVSGNASRLIWR
jgi:hypothetical protein